MLSKRHKVIFVHIPKTGGQSVAELFLQDLGLGWEQREALLLRPGEAGQPERLAHLYAREYVALGFVSPAEFADFTKFAVVRHPYARMVSEYVYRMGPVGWCAQYVQRWQSRHFDHFIAQEFDNPLGDAARHFAPQADFVMDAQGQLMVDHVIDHAHLAEQIAPVFREIFGRDVALAKRNVKREAPRFSAEVLTRAQKDVLYARYREDFEAFGFAR